MPSSSGKVKLNRAALKGLQLVPRRRRKIPNAAPDRIKQDAQEVSEGLLTEQVAPESMNDKTPDEDLEKNYIGTKRIKKGNNSAVRVMQIKMASVQEGVLTRGRYHQSKPNTRRKSRLDTFNKQHNSRSTCILCSNTDLASVAVNRKRAMLIVKKPLASNKSATTCIKRRVCLKQSASTETCEVHIAHSKRACGGRDRQDRVIARPAPCVRRSVAEPGQALTGTRSKPPGLSKNGRIVHPSPAGQADSEESVRSTSKVSNSVVCKHVSPQQKLVGKQGQGNCSPGREHPVVTDEIKNETTVTEHKTVLWTHQNPKVILCDIGQKCGRCSHNCGFVLPDVINNKVVTCFKKDMRAGFQFEPGCFRYKKHRRDESTATENNELWHRVQSEQKTCQPRNVNEHQKNVKKYTGARTLSTHPYNFVKCLTNELSATCFSLLQGKCKKREQCLADKDIEENPGPSFKFGILTSPAYLESIWSKNQSKTDSRDKQKTDSGMSFDSQSSLELDQTMEDIHKKSCGQISSTGETEASHKFSGSDTENDMGNIGNPDDPESFSCQRVRIYSKKTIVSCARAYMPWPFSDSGRTPAGPADIVGCPAKHHGTLATDCSNSPFNYSLQDSITDATSKPSRVTFDQTSHQHKEKNGTKDGPKMESMLEERNVERHVNMTSDSLKSKNGEYLPHLMGAAESPAGVASDLSLYYTGAQQATATTHAALCSPVHEPESSASSVTPSPSQLGLSDEDTTTTLSGLSPPFTNGHLSNLLALAASAPERQMFYSEETQMTYDSSSSVYPHSLDSSNSCDSSLLLPQDESDKTSTSSSPPRLEPYYKTSPISHYLPAAIRKENLLNGIPTEVWSVDTNFDMFLLPPLLSPVVSPRAQSETNSSDEEEDDNNNNRSGYDMHEVVKIMGENSRYYLCDKRSRTSSSNHDDTSKGDKTDCEKGNTPVNNYSKQVPSDPKIRVSHTSGVQTKSCSSPSSDEDGTFTDERQVCLVEGRSSSYEIVRSKAEAADDPHSNILDEFLAYKQDILLVDVMQDDPELFDNMPMKSLLKLGPVRVSKVPKTRATEVSKTQRVRITVPEPEISQRMTPVNTNFHCDSPDTTENTRRPWRPQNSSTTVQSSPWYTTDKRTKTMGQSVAENSLVKPGLERTQPIQTGKNHIPLMTMNSGLWTTNPANMTDFRCQKTNAYCWQYFSESLSCGFKMCRFQHVPMEGDEKFCVDTVKRFAKNPMCLNKAGAVFTGYYQSNPPGVYFSMSVLLSLLWALLKVGLMSEIFSVLSVSLAHKIVPDHEFLLALFKVIRERGLTAFVSKLMQLTFKMANAGLVLSLDCLDCVKNTPEFQQAVHTNSSLSVYGNNEYLILVNAVMEIELCTKQEDWRQMREVFNSICQFNRHPNQIERISGRIAIALLSESKDKLSLPFAAFAETVCQKNDEGDGISRSFLGRIGVSLMLRYHKTHHWAKGQKVVEILTASKISFSTLKGLFGNEDCTSRCHLITVATELYLLSGCVEGALNILRENEWFLTSHLWPCEAADLESRTRVLMCLAEKTSHRDTLKVLCNLPGLQEKNGNIDSSRHTPVFNSHLQACVDRQILPVASDTVDFMLSKNLAVDHVMLQALLHKLGKQNNWLRAREIFRRCLSEGYYPGVSAPPGLMTLVVPSQLGEVELALTFEMFITANAAAISPLSGTTTSTLSITLNRTKSCESEYLSAGCRVLSAACIPQPKLTIHYTAVNSSQEQVFTLDISSARRWLHHNSLWANELWTKLFPPTAPGNPCLPLP